LKKPDHFNLTFKAFGEYGLLIEWPAIISEAVLNDIIRLQATLEKQDDLGINETVNAYNSLTLLFDPGKISVRDLIRKIRTLYTTEGEVESPVRRLWHVPVCYEPKFSVDLPEISQSKGMKVDEIISLHSTQTYTVYFIGFLPGFLYLGGLREELHTPRRATPRTRIAKGSVAIGGAQTGIYPSESPGGWNIIGNCPLELFDSSQDPPCFAKAGDALRFHPIGDSEYSTIKEKVSNGKYIVKSENL